MSSRLLFSPSFDLRQVLALVVILFVIIWTPKQKAGWKIDTILSLKCWEKRNAYGQLSGIQCHMLGELILSKRGSRVFGWNLEVALLNI